MDEATRSELSDEGRAAIAAVDGYLGQTIRAGHPIEALIATRQLGEITSDRAKEAARAATEGSWSWSDVGRALGVSKQAAHEKLRGRVHAEFAKVRSKLERVEQVSHAKVVARAQRGRDKLEPHREHPKVRAARGRVDDWERRSHGKVDRNLQKAREQLARAEQKAQRKLEKKGSAE